MGLTAYVITSPPAPVPALRTMSIRSTPSVEVYLYGRSSRSRTAVRPSSTVSCGIEPTSIGGFFSGFGWIRKIFTSSVTPGPVVFVELLRPQYRQSPAMPKPLDPHPVGNPSRSPPLHLPVAGSFFDGAVGSQCSHSKLRNRPSLRAATKAPLCASSGEEVGSSSPLAFSRPPGSVANGISKVVKVAGTQSAGLPSLGLVQRRSCARAAGLWICTRHHAIDNEIRYAGFRRIVPPGSRAAVDSP